MPLSMEKFAGKRVTVIAVIDEDEVTLDYLPNLITPQFAAEIQTFEQSDDLQELAKSAQRKVHEMFLKIVKKWDLVEKEGDTSPIALTVEALEAVDNLYWLEVRLLGFLRQEVSDLGGVSKRYNGHSPGTTAARGR